jgi:hypothetical protein
LSIREEIPAQREKEPADLVKETESFRRYSGSIGESLDQTGWNVV